MQDRFVSKLAFLTQTQKTGKIDIRNKIDTLGNNDIFNIIIIYIKAYIIRLLSFLGHFCGFIQLGSFIIFLVFFCTYEKVYFTDKSIQSIAFKFF